MTNATLEGFRRLAEAMLPEKRNWQWIGPHMSQRYFGITKEKAIECALRYGGNAQEMKATPPTEVK